MRRRDIGNIFCIQGKQSEVRLGASIQAQTAGSAATWNRHGNPTVLKNAGGLTEMDKIGYWFRFNVAGLEPSTRVMCVARWAVAVLVLMSTAVAPLTAFEIEMNSVLSAFHTRKKSLIVEGKSKRDAWVRSPRSAG